MQFDDLVFVPPADLESVATAVIARGRRRRQLRRARFSVASIAMAILAAFLPIALAPSANQSAPRASRPGADHRQVRAGDHEASPVAGSALEPSTPGGAGATERGPGTAAPPVRVPAAPSGSAPDRVAFVSAGPSQLNDIFLYDAARRTTAQLTTDPATDSWPTWSPDGSRIAFHSDRRGAAEIYVMRADGSGQRRITAFGAGYQAMQPAWSPDGSRIAFTLSRRPVAQATVTEFEDFAVWLIRPDGSGARALLDHAAQPAWSPDGRSLAFVAEDQLKVVDLATGKIRVIVTGFVNLPAWSPDGARITYQQSRGGRDQIYIVNSDGTNGRRAFASSSFDYAPSFSPDGARLVFRHDPDGPERLYCENFNPAPSGCRGPGTAPGQLWVVDLARGGAGPLIDGRVGDDFLPRFAPFATTLHSR